MEKERHRQIKDELGDIPSAHVNVLQSIHQPATLLLCFQQRYEMTIIFNSSLYHNPYGHNIMKDYMCVHRTHDHSHQAVLPWGVIKCSLIP